MTKSTFTVILTIFSSYLFAQIPTAYYNDVSNQSGTELQTTLHNIIDDHTTISYSAIWDAFEQTDSKENGKVWDMYSDIPDGTPDYEYSFGSNQCGNYSGEGDCYNREHSFPKSWFGDQSPMSEDLFHIYPTDGYVNGKRGNYPLGETNSPTWTSTNGSKLGTCSYPGYTGIIFEPIDTYKGDLARSYFYMATRYYNEDSSWPGSTMTDGAEPKTWAMTMLLEWSKNDPVSQKELNRNDSIYNIQHNRNPFIDHPEYATSIWGDGASLVSAPTNHVVDFSSTQITLNWNDASGENLPSGYLIFISDTSFDDIPTPIDGNSPSNYTDAKVVSFGTETCTFGNLEQNRSYFFKIYSFIGSGNNTDYKTDGNIPQLWKNTN
jgi:endonuclease I